MHLKIVQTEDEELKKKIKEGLKNNDGYCPCLITRTPDSKCMCREFREQLIEGSCHCGLFRKVMI